MKYFYIDPLAAAYMAKHYGMRIGIVEPANRLIAVFDGARLHGGEDFIEFTLEDFYTWLKESEAIDWQFYIHPDSYHLLEPQVGDLIEYGAMTGYCRNRNSLEMNSQDFELYEEDIVKKEYKIVQRNGKAFFWPEVES